MTITAVQIAELSDAEVASLIEALQADLDTLKDAAIIRVREEWEEKAASLGMTPAEVWGFDAKRKRAKGTPKYRNPADPTQTWTGRGKRPGWLKGVEDIEQCRIPEAA